LGELTVMSFFSCIICMADSFPINSVLEQIHVNLISFPLFKSVVQIIEGPMYTCPWLVCTNKHVDCVEVRKTCGRIVSLDWTRTGGADV
jgi:hypothetical protein